MYSPMRVVQRCLLAVLIFVAGVEAHASALRLLDADSFISSDHTKTYSLPAATDTLVGRASTDTLTNKSISGATNTFTLIGDASLTTSYLKADGTRALTASWSAGAFSATFNSVIVGSAANRISGLSTIVNTGTLTLPTATDTLVGRATTDTFTGKTISGASNTLSQLPVGAQTIQVVVTPYPNSSGTSFTLSTAPAVTAAVALYLDGVLLIQGATADYTISGSTITMTTAPATGQVLHAIYSQY